MTVLGGGWAPCVRHGHVVSANPSRRVSQIRKRKLGKLHNLPSRRAGRSGGQVSRIPEIAEIRCETRNRLRAGSARATDGHRTAGRVRWEPPPVPPPQDTAGHGRPVGQGCAEAHSRPPAAFPPPHRARRSSPLRGGAQPPSSSSVFTLFGKNPWASGDGSDKRGQGAWDLSPPF